MEEEKTRTVAMVEPRTNRKRRKVGRCRLANSEDHQLLIVVRF